ncbi:hypothetical protein EWS92_15665 [Vibrio vulnificus]|uniref:hypothetical protein n=1 Tax=Vibrio vulnificus TaxID=672 RepID=UPI0018DC607D|nr:hypothetical protein [Vibrio vulnificus]EGR0790930.1 hypothetical protein [Vibrio vulnificus]EGR0798442.1 hypothetical protein [Vibrio vulnificus]EGR0815572.1 hypothetical protein [Vibrio vulnificus]EGR0826670.1 hypothetical protein [Vibrio vulnificus]EGR0847997.1 hypothetical protein [Vibrio vulnificus]
MIKSIVNMRGFETPEKAEEETKKRIKQLYKVDTSAHHLLAGKMEDCIDYRKQLGEKLGKLCNSRACFLCNKDLREKVVDEYAELIDGDPHDYMLMTIIPYQLWFKHHDLEHFNLSWVKREFREQLRSAGFRGPIIGMFEMDFHTPDDVWAPHFHLILPYTDKNLLAFENYQSIKNWSDAIEFAKHVSHRPFHHKPIKENEVTETVSYIHKMMPREITHYIDKNGEKKTRPRRLKSQLFADSLIKIDQWSYATLRILWDKKGRW